jgi:hypothetical protein
MGEYYIATLLDRASRITRAVHPADYGISERLGAQTREGTPFLVAVEILLGLDGGARLVWAGDYAAREPGHDTNLYWAIQPHQFVRFEGLIDPDADITANTPRPTVPLGAHIYVCNADRHEYFDKRSLPMDDYEQPRNMLPALTAHGHGRPGRWARNRIYLTETHPGDTWTKVPSLLWT